ncbi:alkane 1-monooxygenase [Sulfitobacter sp. D35]|uniref:alkane 1-monooxygenase n=1 Tax=Sulfitobacter sp. D35 TaxID=3083252 RepID=UPI00296F09EC|nr:alkane 1-monooxygenase [Sulfitobacter sp. D35]MDW4498319.1 alkane 1-monooxygenase [Sulfitobacter sp. D35]
MSDTSRILPPSEVARFTRALPFWMSFLLPPVAVFGAYHGGWTVILLPLMTWYLFSALDAVIGTDRDNADLATGEDHLSLYRAVTIAWVPVQFVTLFGLLWYVPQAAHLGTWERLGLFFGVGVITGTIGINYSHELMHQKSHFERWLGDILLAMVLYSHFRSEHLVVHHRYVGTPRDPVTARYGEGFYRFFPRVLWQCLVSSFRGERARLQRGNRPAYDRTNPFWRYATLQGFMLLLAFLLAGWAGIGFFLLQAVVAIWQLELVNYVEHYGLTRKHLGDGRYEHVKPHHSWNSDQKTSNWLLINLQRHSDHHYKPDRRYPVLQTYGPDAAPQLPFGYPVMTMLAMVPPLWRRVMNPRVQAWRSRHYPDVADWSAYDSAANPQPR